MGKPIFTKEVILHLKSGTEFNDTVRILSEQLCLFQGIDYCKGAENGYHQVAHGVGCDKVTEESFSGYGCVTSAEVRDIGR